MCREELQSLHTKSHGHYTNMYNWIDERRTLLPYDDGSGNSGEPAAASPRSSAPASPKSPVASSPKSAAPRPAAQTAHSRPLANRGEYQICFSEIDLAQFGLRCLYFFCLLGNRAATDFFVSLFPFQKATCSNYPANTLPRKKKTSPPHPPIPTPTPQHRIGDEGVRAPELREPARGDEEADEIAAGARDSGGSACDGSPPSRPFAGGEEGAGVGGPRGAAAAAAAVVGGFLPFPGSGDDLGALLEDGEGNGLGVLHEESPGGERNDVD